MHTVDQVLHIIREKVYHLPPHHTDLAPVGGAGGMGVLAQDVHLDADSPPFARSQLDGYALRSQDARPGAELELIGHLDAGAPPFTGILRPGTCVAINAGEVVPETADAILMVEHTARLHRAGRDFIAVHHAVAAGTGIQPRGTEARAGDLILPAGTRLGPAQRAACAAAGVARPLIRRPRVAILSTGDELLPIATPAPLPPGKIRNSNQLMLRALAADADAQVLDLGTAPDETDPLRRALERGIAEADLLVVCGGMSMGTRDLVPPLLKDLGFTLHVEKVLIKPGKPFILGTFDPPQAQGLHPLGDARKYVAGLPGNPVSAFVTFHRFVRAILRRLEAADDSPRMVPARLDRPLPANTEREFNQPCILRPGRDALIAELLPWKGSADLFTLARATGLIIHAAAAPALPAGAPVNVLTW